MANTVPTVRNITRVFRQASADQLADGIAWYPNAYAFCLELDPDNPAKAAEITAILSAKTKWEANMALVRLVYQYGPDALVGRPATPDNIAKVRRVWAGEAPGSVVSGPKVTAFYAAIMGDLETIVIDRHAYDIAVNHVYGDDHRPTLGTKAGQITFTDTYRRAAERLGYPPAVVQAVTWTVWIETRTKFAKSNVAKRAARGTLALVA